MPLPLTLSQHSNLGGKCGTPTHQLPEQSLVTHVRGTHNVERAHDEHVAFMMDPLSFGMNALLWRYGKLLRWMKLCRIAQEV